MVKRILATSASFFLSAVLLMIIWVLCLAFDISLIYTVQVLCEITVPVLYAMYLNNFPRKISGNFWWRIAISVVLCHIVLFAEHWSHRWEDLDFQVYGFTWGPTVASILYTMIAECSLRVGRRILA